MDNNNKPDGYPIYKWIIIGIVLVVFIAPSVAVNIMRMMPPPAYVLIPEDIKQYIIDNNKDLFRQLNLIAKEYPIQDFCIQGNSNRTSKDKNIDVDESFWPLDDYGDFDYFANNAIVAIGITDEVSRIHIHLERIDGLKDARMHTINHPIEPGYPVLYGWMASFPSGRDVAIIKYINRISGKYGERRMEVYFDRAVIEKDISNKPRD